MGSDIRSPLPMGRPRPSQTASLVAHRLMVSLSGLHKRGPHTSTAITATADSVTSLSPESRLKVAAHAVLKLASTGPISGRRCVAPHRDVQAHLRVTESFCVDRPRSHPIAAQYQTKRTRWQLQATVSSLSPHRKKRRNSGISTGHSTHEASAACSNLPVTTSNQPKRSADRSARLGDDACGDA